MIPLEIEPIRKHLRQKKIDAHFQKETDQLYFLLKIAETEFPVFIRIMEGGELLQLLSFLPCNFKESTLSDTARLLHMLNREMDIPGFGLDENSSVVFYRLMIPAKEKAIDGELLDAYLSAIDMVCHSFAPVIAAVAFGGMTLNEVLKQAKTAANTIAKQTPKK